MDEPIVVVTQPHHTRTQPQPVSPFALGFAVTLGVLVALAIIAPVAYWFYDHEREKPLREIRDLATQRQQAHASERAKVLSFAKRQLPKYGIVEISNEADTFDYQGRSYFAGSGKDKAGKIRKFIMEYEVSTFGNETHWKLTQLTMDGERKLEAK